MPFNSYLFLFGFLPVVLVGYDVFRSRSARQGQAWLLASSWVFYAWWVPMHLPLMLLSIGINRALAGRFMQPDSGSVARRRWLWAGLTFNLGMLGLFKYAGLFVATAGGVASSLGWAGADQWTGPELALPLGISFFTFQQVAFLVDGYRRGNDSVNATSYALFVSFFPQLVAGPIVHHDDLTPQLEAAPQPTSADRAIGLSVFAVGLFKKCVIADSVAGWADVSFAIADSGSAISFSMAWLGALAYSLQLYFDFSGYSDMAIGLGRLLGIRLPVNFDAPYRAATIASFWRRWHMTLSSFLRDYLYIPLGGNRCSPARQRLNLMITMLLGGLWHGASWSFLLWGGLHGTYLVVQRMWSDRGLWRMPTALARALTLLVVIVAWVPFRATTWQGTGAMLQAMLGLSAEGWGPMPDRAIATLLVLFVATQALPTTQTWMRDFPAALQARRQDIVSPDWLPAWAPTRRTAVICALLFLVALPVVERADAFLYWQF